MEFHAFVTMDIAVKIQNLGNWFPFSKASVCFLTARERYFALRDRMTPWVIFITLNLVKRKFSIAFHVILIVAATTLIVLIF